MSTGASPCVTRVRRGDILQVTIDNPPVNALGVDVRRGLLDAIDAAINAIRAGTAKKEGKRRTAKYAVVTMCVAGGMGAAGLFETYRGLSWT